MRPLTSSKIYVKSTEKKSPPSKKNDLGFFYVTEIVYISIVIKRNTISFTPFTKSTLARSRSNQLNRAKKALSQQNTLVSLPLSVTSLMAKYLVYLSVVLGQVAKTTKAFTSNLHQPKRRPSN